MNQQVTSSTKADSAVINVAPWQAGYCLRTMHWGVDDRVPESKCQKTEQRRKASGVLSAWPCGEQPLEWKWNRFQVLHRNTKWSITRERQGKSHRLMKQRQLFLKGEFLEKQTHAWERWLVSAPRQQNFGSRASEGVGEWRDFCRMWKKATSVQSN